MNDNLQATLTQRGDRYGDFADNAAVAQKLKDVVRDTIQWPKLDRTKREAIDQICSKLSRILTASPDYKDNWLDIAGYAKLAEDRCRPLETEHESKPD
jgi:hypothetical protein